MALELENDMEMSFFWDQLYHQTYPQDANATVVSSVANDSWSDTSPLNWTFSNSTQGNSTDDGSVKLLHAVGKAIILGLVILSTVIGESTLDLLFIIDITD
jgi:hypothetical protein